MGLYLSLLLSLGVFVQWAPKLMLPKSVPAHFHGANGSQHDIESLLACMSLSESQHMNRWPFTLVNYLLSTTWADI